MRVVWLAMSGLCALGLLSVAVMREVPVRRTTDERCGLEEGADARESGAEMVGKALPVL